MPRTIDWGLTKDILNGVAIASLIFAISVYMPFLGSFGIYFLPLPIIFYRLKLGRGNGAIIPVATFCFMAMIIGSISFELLFFFRVVVDRFCFGRIIGVGPVY